MTERNCSGVSRVAGAPGRDPRPLQLEVLRRVLVGHLGGEEAGGDRVDADALAARPLLGEVAGQAVEPRLAGAVRGLRQARGGEAQHARDVDDAAARLHDRRGGLGHPVGAVEVDVDDAAELLGRLARGGDRGAHAGVVDEDVDAAQLADRGLDQRAGVLGLADVGGDGDRPAARGLHQRLRVLEAVGAAGAQRYVGSRLGQRLGERDTQAGGRAGDDGDLAVEAEGVQDGGQGGLGHAVNAPDRGGTTTG
ncbi:MAG: hypothetical protein QOF86_1266 [Baekduia sp.]|nr:hypothetical protein [Baekduia sp.]